MPHVCVRPLHFFHVHPLQALVMLHESGTIQVSHASKELCSSCFGDSYPLSSLLTLSLSGWFSSFASKVQGEQQRLYLYVFSFLHLFSLDFLFEAVTVIQPY